MSADGARAFAAINWACAQGLPGLMQPGLIVIAKHADKMTGFCRLKMETIGRELGCTERTARRVVKQLESRGKIWVQRLKGKSCRFWVLFGAPCQPAECPPSSPARRPVSRQLELDLSPDTVSGGVRTHDPPELPFSELPKEERSVLRTEREAALVLPVAINDNDEKPVRVAPQPAASGAALAPQPHGSAARADTTPPAPEATSLLDLADAEGATTHKQAPETHIPASYASSPELLEPSHAPHAHDLVERHAPDADLLGGADQAWGRSNAEKPSAAVGQCRLQAQAVCRSAGPAASNVSIFPTSNEVGKLNTPDARWLAWNEGPKTLARLTGKTIDSCKPLLGKLLRELRDDCAGLLELLDDTERERRIAPVPWLMKAARQRSGRRHDLGELAALLRDDLDSGRLEQEMRAEGFIA